MSETTHEIRHAADMTASQKYRLMTSVIVPRPIGWLSTRSASGIDNLAPFSYFNAFASEPMLVGAAIGRRGEEPKDTLVNIRDTGVFCANMVTARHLVSMNQTAGDYPAGVSEFEAAGIACGQALAVDAPYVADCPVVLECRLFKEVELGAASTTLVIGEILAVRLGPETRDLWHGDFLDTHSLKPVGRLWAGYYALVDGMLRLDRPKIDRETGEDA